jgi:dTDP-4-dehydrorhamnose 3,5-epimerase
VSIEIQETFIKDLKLVRSKIRADERGYFQRLHCADSLRLAGLPSNFPQSNISHNLERGILRGMHYQEAPYQEDKLVRCISGAILDVAIDLRKASPTFGRHFKIELNEADGVAIMIPKGFAHGYLTLTTGATVLYHVTTPYAPDSERGIRWNDKFFQISWPLHDPTTSTKDSNWPDFKDSSAL